jgi:hypothetical protein
MVQKQCSECELSTLYRFLLNYGHGHGQGQRQGNELCKSSNEAQDALD